MQDSQLTAPENQRPGSAAPDPLGELKHSLRLSSCEKGARERQWGRDGREKNGKRVSR